MRVAAGLGSLGSGLNFLSSLENLGHLNLAEHRFLSRVSEMVTFSPRPRYNSPRLNDLANRSNEYLTSKRFLLTTILFPAIEGREHRAPARSVPRSPTLSHRTPPAASSARRFPLPTTHFPRLLEPTYLLYHHTVTNSLSSRKLSTPLFSIKSTLLLQKHRGGGIPSGSKLPASSLQTGPPASRIGQNHASSITQPSDQRRSLSAPHRSRTAMPLPSGRPFLRALPSPRGNRSRAGLSRGAHS